VLVVRPLTHKDQIPVHGGVDGILDAGVVGPSVVIHGDGPGRARARYQEKNDGHGEAGGDDKEERVLFHWTSPEDNGCGFERASRNSVSRHGASCLVWEIYIEFGKVGMLGRRFESVLLLVLWWPVLVVWGLCGVGADGGVFERIPIKLEHGYNG